MVLYGMTMLTSIQQYLKNAGFKLNEAVDA